MQAKNYSKHYKQVIYLYRNDFLECQTCGVHHKNPDHQCKPQEDAKRIDGYWAVTKIYSHPNVDLVKYTLEKGDEVIGHSVFNTQDLEFEIGDLVELMGWQKQESRHNVLLATAVQPKFNNEIVGKIPIDALASKAPIYERKWVKKKLGR